MRKGGGKQKGSQFEREICRRLSLWVSDGKQTDLYWRSAMSGGRATVAQRKGVDVRQAGDITAVAPEGHILTDYWYIECKHYADLALKGFFLRDTGILAAFWRHTQLTALQHNRQPMLIAKENSCPTLALINSKTLFTIRADFRTPLWWSSRCELYLLDDLLAIPYDDYFNHVPAPKKVAAQ